MRTNHAHTHTNTPHHYRVCCIAYVFIMHFSWVKSQTPLLICQLSWVPILISPPQDDQMNSMHSASEFPLRKWLHYFQLAKVLFRFAVENCKPVISVGVLIENEWLSGEFRIIRTTEICVERLLCLHFWYFMRRMHASRALHKRTNAARQPTLFLSHELNCLTS